MLQAPDPDRTVALFGRRVPVGDFRPWARLLILGGMLTAVSFAARSLSKQIAAEKLRESLVAASELDERMTLAWHPLFPMDGFPSPWAGGASGAHVSQVLTGTVLAPDGSPLAGAVVRIPGRSSLTRADGFFELPGAPCQGGVPVRIDPPAGRTDLTPIAVKGLLPGLPGTRAPLGVLTWPTAGGGAPAPPLDVPDGESVLYATSEAPVAGEGLGGWKPAGAWAHESSDAASWFRRLDVKGNVYALSSPARDPSGARAGTPLENAPLEGTVELPEGVMPLTVGVHADVLGSGRCVAAAVQVESGRARFRFPALPVGDHRLVVNVTGCLPTCLDFALPLPGDEPGLRAGVEPGAEVSVYLDDVQAGERAAYALRIVAPWLRTALVGFPPEGPLVLRGLPAETLRFELVRSSPLLTTAALDTAPFERTGLDLTRTLVTGAKNPRVVFHLDGVVPALNGPRPIVATGTARPGSVVYRLGAHADDPASWCRADAAGTFRLAAPAGSRIFAADGAWPRLVPFAAGRAAPRVAFDEPVKLRIRLAQVDVADREAELTLRFTGPESFGQGARVERVEGRSKIEIALVPADVPFEVQVHAGGRLRTFQGRTPERGAFDVDTTAIAAR